MINYVTKLKLEGIVLIILLIVVFHIIVVGILLFLLADAAALDSIVTDVARRLSLLVMALRRRRGVGTVVTVVAFLARLNVEKRQKSGSRSTPGAVFLLEHCTRSAP